MTSDINQIDPYFMQIVLSLQAAAMQQMGKVMNPATSKIDRDLVMAQNSIDMLAMIEAKTKNNLSEQEEKLINHVLYELRLNFVDESKKKDEPTVTEDKTETVTDNNQEKENE